LTLRECRTSSSPQQFRTDPTKAMPSRRIKKLTRPGFQLRLSATFLGLALLGQLLQFLLASTFLQVAARDVAGGEDLAATAAAVSLSAFFLAVVVTTPVVLVFGVMMTHRIAGPAHRLASYLNEVAEGVQTEPCSLRKGDELQELCEQVNRTTAPLRARALVSADRGPAFDRHAA
jgi:methyl-accepting chemotaxis protein